MSSIDGVSVSWVRTRVLPAQIVGTGANTALAHQPGYLARFPAAGEHAVWRRPWIDDDSFSYFWSRSFGPNYRRVAADKAWKRQVPLREATPPVLTTSQTGVTLATDRFAYPSGVGVVVRADVIGPLDTASLLTIVAALANSNVVSVAGATRPKAMAAVLGDLLDGAERALHESGDPNAVEITKPITIATVTATTDWPTAPVAPADGTHRLLEGLCRLSAAPLTGTVGTLADGLLAEARSHPGTSRYALGRATAALSPNQSGSPDGAHRLSCYHLNQTLAALQVGVLLDTARWASTLPVIGLSQSVKDSLAPVVNILGLLYGKVPDMYASAFVRRQISDSGLVPAIGNLRIVLGVGGPLK